MSFQAHHLRPSALRNLAGGVVTDYERTVIASHLLICDTCSRLVQIPMAAAASRAATVSQESSSLAQQRVLLVNEGLLERELPDEL